MSNLGIEELIDLEFKEDILPPALMTHKKNDKSKMIFKIPILHTKESIFGTFNHEIGTHFVRRYNH